ncbi:MAG: hypothetical protein CMM54_02375 [Rhodospirillaceae bacterium]|nr:hypothetical protein [Rhodospirillaceae bacterium]|tara:strand:- start:7213 stop:8031 length:819 start_codon:yes stop_codon:yes gene_type:complete
MRVEAYDLYAGRSYREATAAARILDAPLWIISAGMGLVSSRNEPITPYNLTISYGPDSVIKKISDDTWSPTRWWDLITSRRGGRTIANIVNDNKNSECVLLFALSKNYAKMVRNDIGRIHEKKIDMVRFFGRGLEDIFDDKFKQCIMPYDSKLNGPNSTYKGAMGDFSQRAMRHYVDLVIENPTTLGVNARNDQDAVADAIRNWTPPKRIKRPVETNENILSLISIDIENYGGGSGKLLRRLRDHHKIACEQGRFKNLYKQAVEMHSKKLGK